MPAPDKAKAKEQTLALAFEGRWSHAEMAARVGVSTRTIERWVRTPDFIVRLEALRSDLAVSLRDTVYVAKAQRIIGLAQMAESARREYERRPWLCEVRQIGRDGETGEPLTMTNESFNRDAHAAFRGALDDIAKELGQRTAKADASAQIALIAVAGDVLDAI